MPLTLRWCLRLQNRPLPGQASFHCGGGAARCQGCGGMVPRPATCHHLAIHHQGHSSGHSPRLPCGPSDSTAPVLALSQGFSPARCCPPGGGRLTPSISAFAQPGTLTPGPLSEVALSPPGTQPLRAAGTVIHFANELTNKRYYRRMIFISLGKFSFIQITTNLILICPHYV